ncbi:MAG: NAD(P)H-dependent flavin oxidoreductase [Flavobacteriaceae bacterium]|jgi:enoyl-[acyl-carrier protein] reductase II
MHNCITKLFKIKYPIVQAGMVWNSGWKLASASSNAGILGLIGAGSMYPDTLREHIKKCKLATKNPFGVNVPLLYPNIKQIMEIIVEENVKIVFTSAGNPNQWTSWLKKNGVIVVHVVSSLKFAEKAANAGVDAIVAEGFEAGGHNGREETTTFALVPLICRQLSIPVISAGGIATGRGFLAAMALGANGVQIGSRFVASVESSAHMAFKKAVIDSKEGDTKLTLKELTPVRLLKNKFYDDLVSLYKDNPTKNDLKSFLGRARAKLGMFEGELDDGELEIGQISAIINKILPVEIIVNEIIDEYNSVINELKSINK